MLLNFSSLSTCLLCALALHWSEEDRLKKMFIWISSMFPLTSLMSQPFYCENDENSNLLIFLIAFHLFRPSLKKKTKNASPYLLLMHGKLIWLHLCIYQLIVIVLCCCLLYLGRKNIWLINQNTIRKFHSNTYWVTAQPVL